MTNSDKILGVFEPGQEFDGWRLLGALRSGGQGGVIRAETQDGSQPVAIKVVFKHGPDDVRRFARERDILASIRHEGVVMLLASGEYQGKLPYLVLEFVQGAGLDRYADERCLPLEDRCQLVLRACAIIDDLHRKAVVHCDLKPSNVLATSGGQLKVIDFGSAFVQDNPAHGGSGAENPGTTQYMSPEQVSGEPLNAQTDVYSLGVVLYELLCGSLPFEIEADAKAAILRGNPQPPSAAVFRTNRVLRDGELRHLDPILVAQTRATAPDALAARLRQGFDDVILTALRVERGRRYPTVRHLMAAVEGALRGGA